MLTIERIFAFDDNTISEISSRLHQITLATLLHGIETGNAERMLRTFSHSQRRTIEDLKHSKAPTPAELASAFIKLITDVRGLTLQGYLRFDKIAPDLVIPEGVEEKIGRSIKTSEEPADGHAPMTEPESEENLKSSRVASPTTGEGGDVLFLKGKVQTLSKENIELKNELKSLRDKLAQIRRIA